MQFRHDGQRGGAYHLLEIKTTVPAAESATGGRLGLMTGPVGHLMFAQARSRHRDTAGRTGQLLEDVAGAALLPGSHRPRLVLHTHQDLVVAGGGAGVTAPQGPLAHLPTGRTVPGVAVVPATDIQRGHTQKCLCIIP